MTIESMIKGGWFGTSPFVDRLVIVAPAHPSNYYPNRICKPISLFIHEPQEPADERESTPVYFQTPNVGGSTRWYADNDGDLYQMVPFPCSAIANGLDGKLEPVFGDGGEEFGGRSLNDTSDNIEVEGNTATISQTFSNAQFGGVHDWLVMGYILWDLPRNVKRTLPHGYVSRQRTDGIWIVEKSGVVQEAVNTVLKLEKDVADLQALAWQSAVKHNGQDVIMVDHALRLNAYQLHTAHPPGK